MLTQSTLTTFCRTRTRTLSLFLTLTFARQVRLLERAFAGCSRVVVTKLHGGFSGSLVLKTDSYGPTGSRDEPTVTKLDDALPHGLLHRRESRSSTRACYRSNRPSQSVSRSRLPLRGAPRTQLFPARLSQRQPVGGGVGVDVQHLPRPRLAQRQWLGAGTSGGRRRASGGTSRPGTT